MMDLNGKARRIANAASMIAREQHLRANFLVPSRRWLELKVA
jgi:hypothetical protein